MIEKYAVHPHDAKPSVDLATPLSVELFMRPPADVLNTHLKDIIGNRFLAKKGTTERERELSTVTEEVTADYFEGCKYIGLVFSANNCAPCYTMMQLLRNFYTDINLEERLFEVVLVSADKNEKDWKDHFNTMPWLSIPFGDMRNFTLAREHEVSGVP